MIEIRDTEHRHTVADALEKLFVAMRQCAMDENGKVPVLNPHSIARLASVVVSAAGMEMFGEKTVYYAKPLRVPSVSYSDVNAILGYDQDDDGA